MEVKEKCPKCQADLGEITEIASGRKLQRCSKGSWNSEARKNEGCDYVKWIVPQPETLDEKCPRCGQPLVLQVTRFGKKLKKCSTGGWDREAKKATGCDYVEWQSGTTQKLDEECPTCGKPLVLFTTAKGKKLEKCSTAGWDPKLRKPTGCPYIQWLKGDVNQKSNYGEEFLPPENI